MMIGKKILAIFRSVPIFAMAYSKKVCRLFNNKKNQLSITRRLFLYGLVLNTTLLALLALTAFE